MMFGPVGLYNEDWRACIEEGFSFDPSFRCEDVDGSYEAVKGFRFFKSFIAFEGVKLLSRVCSFGHVVLIADVGLRIVASTISGLEPIPSATCCCLL